ncbi:hypothetical protein CDAR_51441 [Caerostris darwini]|uniref:Uncharacterized protein n=1 Tax=Caerostris darwini TaxID=1538125 RepID=A0AAV4U659_9ARAC|nr:hypothetical protein CDAR_51441 [Caerostris darwini]
MKALKCMRDFFCKYALLLNATKPIGIQMIHTLCTLHQQNMRRMLPNHPHNRGIFALLNSRYDSIHHGEVSHWMRLIMYLFESVLLANRGSTPHSGEGVFCATLQWIER